MIPYTIVRSKRKTVGIYIRPEGRVEVRAPLKLPQKDIEKIVAEKEAWIAPRLAESRQRLAEKAAFARDNEAIIAYKQLAADVLPKKAAVFAPLLGVTPTAVKVNSAKTRGGSCSAKNSINFSWRLIMADEDVIDYVVVHELAHIREHNHSPNFWGLVEGVLPDYRQRRQKLKQLHDRLSRENWD